MFKSSGLSIADLIYSIQGLILVRQYKLFIFVSSHYYSQKQILLYKTIVNKMMIKLGEWMQTIWIISLIDRSTNYAFYVDNR